MTALVREVPVGCVCYRQSGRDYLLHVSRSDCPRQLMLHGHPIWPPFLFFSRSRVAPHCICLGALRTSEHMFYMALMSESQPSFVESFRAISILLVLVIAEGSRRTAESHYPG